MPDNPDQMTNTGPLDFEPMIRGMRDTGERRYPEPDEWYCYRDDSGRVSGLWRRSENMSEVRPHTDNSAILTWSFPPDHYAIYVRKDQ